ncbi:major facilitator superfamily transporter [Fusarium beomiforme]|uniref:Major facilitator superfamily transporter n=1 Tax=Fusarium beomiforme TaxID=44412 RepID=A0A9P5AUD7_9HYPO|nr:major facilitator superfamily transporter [Fusarium beomiforme]
MISDVETAVETSNDRTSKEELDVEAKTTATSPDPNVVGWQENDPENPLNWPARRRGSHVVIISFMTLTVNLAATMFAPAAADLAKDFAITNSTVVTLAVSIYMLGFSIGPLLIAPLSELHGRYWIYNICNLCTLAMTIGCAAAPNLGGFLACRFLAGAAGSAPVTIGGGTIADVTTPDNRAKAMSGFALGPLLGPVLGPIAGGFIGADLGWRWTLWILAILSGANGVICILFMRETYAPVILARRAAQIRKETGKHDLRPAGATSIKTSTLILRTSTKAITMLFTNPIVFLLSLFNAFSFGLMFLLFTTFPKVFVGQYNFGTGISGLSYLGLGMGMFIGLVLFGTSDKMLRNLKNGPFRPETRLMMTMYTTPLLAVGLFWYGWAAEEKVHWIVPIIGTSFIGFGIFFIMVSQSEPNEISPVHNSNLDLAQMPSQLYVVDVFGAQGAASALAALAVFRCMFAAFLPLAGPPMYDDLGLGWGNSVLGFLAVAFIPVPIFFYKFGERLRNKN